VVHCRLLTVLTVLAVRTQVMVAVSMALASVALPIDRSLVLIHRRSAFVARSDTQFPVVKRPTAIYAT